MYNKNGLVRDWGLRAYRYTVAAVYTVFLLVASSYHGRARRQHSSYCFSRSTTHTAQKDKNKLIYTAYAW